MAITNLTQEDCTNTVLLIKVNEIIAETNSLASSSIPDVDVQACISTEHLVIINEVIEEINTELTLEIDPLAPIDCNTVTLQQTLNEIIDAINLSLPATIASIVPNEGPEAGSTEVVITGTNFTEATGVTFGGNAGTGFSVVSSTEINVTTPAGTAGAVDVVVLHPNGNITEVNGFTYT